MSSMLAYQKIILEKVSFSGELFHKELKKSLHWLNAEELDQLSIWLNINFLGLYPQIIKTMFETL